MIKYDMLRFIKQQQQQQQRNNNKETKTMNTKFDTTERHRKCMNRRGSDRSGQVLTSHNIKSERELAKWYKMCNSKRGGKSRHILK
jgi:hypothetical protein